MRKLFNMKTMALLLVVTMLGASLAGCNNEKKTSESTTGTADTSESNGGTGSQTALKGDFITIGDEVLDMSIANAYVYSLKSQYESILGSDMWDTEMSEGYTYGDWLKDNVVNQALQLAVLGSKADEYKVALSDEDKETAKEYTTEFMASVSDADKEAYGFTDEDIQALFERTLLANNVYLAILDTINVELTDEEKEECENRTVQHILISTTDTTKTDESGSEVEMSEEEKEAYKAERKALAEEVLQKALAGEDFEALSEEYTSENAGFEFTFDRNGYSVSSGSTMVEPFYTAAWNLEEGQITDVLVESTYGYHIIKCVKALDDDATKKSEENAIQTKKSEEYSNMLQGWIDETDYTISDAWKDYSLKASTPSAGDDLSNALNGNDTESQKETPAETESESQTKAPESATETVPESETNSN